MMAPLSCQRHHLSTERTHLNSKLKLAVLGLSLLRRILAIVEAHSQSRKVRSAPWTGARWEGR